MTDDLWGDLPTGKGIRTPHSILMEQGQALTKKSNGLLVGRVTRAKRADRPDVLISRFDILAPSLNYSFFVTNLVYGFALYPVTLNPPVPEPDVRAESEEQFKNALRKLLASQRVRNAIVGLLSQINAEAEEQQHEAEPE